MCGFGEPRWVIGSNGCYYLSHCWLAEGVRWAQNVRYLCMRELSGESIDVRKTHWAHFARCLAIHVTF